MFKSFVVRKYIFFFFIFFTQIKFGYGQHFVSKYEYKWALRHPFASIKIKKHLKKAMLVYKLVKAEKTLDTLDYGGKLDAFRHTYSMAYLCKFVKIKKMRKLGIAHEKGNKMQFFELRLEFGERPDSLACVMDLKNNELGFEIANNFNSKNEEELKNYVINEIKLGKAYYLKRNSQNSYVNCENEPINLKFYKNVWFIPKCLINTNL